MHLYILFTSTVIVFQVFQNCDDDNLGFECLDDPKFNRKQFHWICHPKNSRIRHILHHYSVLNSRVSEFNGFFLNDDGGHFAKQLL